MTSKFSEPKLPQSNMGNDAAPHDRQQYAFQVFKIFWAKSQGLYKTVDCEYEMRQHLAWRR